MLIESCHPKSHIQGTDDFHGDFSLVASELESDKANYVIYKLPTEGYVFISFVPDKAHVRSKMLYASSSSAIQRQLGGSERFKHVLFWTEFNEVSNKGIGKHTKLMLRQAILPHKKSKL